MLREARLLLPDRGALLRTRRCQPIARDAIDAGSDYCHRVETCVLYEARLLLFTQASLLPHASRSRLAFVLTSIAGGSRLPPRAGLLLTIL